MLALHIMIVNEPRVANAERLVMRQQSPGFWCAVASYGFMERPNIPALLKLARKHNCPIDLQDVVYYVGHETIKHCPDGTGMPVWQEKIFALLQRNAAQVCEYLSLPSDAVVEIGRQVEV